MTLSEKRRPERALERKRKERLTRQEDVTGTGLTFPQHEPAIG